MPKTRVAFTDLNYPATGQPYAQSEWNADMQHHYDQCASAMNSGYREFTAADDGERFIDWVTAALGQLHGCTGTITVHTCTHEDGVVQDCSTQNYRSITVT